MKAFYLINRMLIIICIVTSCGRPKVRFDAVASQKIVPVLINKDHNVVMRIRINIDEDKESVLQRIRFSTQGAVDERDIETMGVYYTGTSDVFSDLVLFGSLQSGVASHIFKSEQTLKRGDNYFWLSVKLNQDADILHKISFKCTEVKVNDTSIMPIDSTSGPLRVGHALRNKGDEGSVAFRIPGLITTSKGTLVAVYDIRWRYIDDLQNDIDIGISRSTDKGQTWLPMQIAMDMGEWGGLSQEQNGIGDPCILLDEQTGRLWIAALWGHGGEIGNASSKVYYTSFSGPGISPLETGQFLLVYSDDDGLTWSAPINITSQVKKPEWNICFQGPGMGITMKDGTLVFPAQIIDKENMNHSTIVFSKDRGQTWQIGTEACAQTNEAQVAEVEPGVLMLNMRSNEGGSRFVSITRDLGKTWEAHPTSHSALRDPACMASLIKVDAARNITGKDILLFSNPDTERGRYNMTIKASFDGGLTWPDKSQLLIDEGYGWGYSCLTMIDFETVGIFYEGSGAHLCFQAIPLTEIVKETSVTKRLTR